MKSLVLLLLLLSLLIFIPQAQAETDTQTRYFNYKADNVNWAGGTAAVSFNGLFEWVVSGTFTYFYKQYADAGGTNTIYIGVRVYKRTMNVTQTQLTSAVSAIASCNYLADYQYLEAAWTAPNTTLDVHDNIAIMLWVSINNSTWTYMTEVTGGVSRSQWNTESLVSTRLLPSTWTFHYSILYWWDEVSTGEIDFYSAEDIGLLEEQSRIENIQLTPYTTTTSSRFYDGFLFGGLLCGMIAAVAILIIDRR